MTDDIRHHATAIYDALRLHAIIHLASLGHAVAAWAESRDIDQDWADMTRTREGI